MKLEGLNKTARAIMVARLMARPEGVSGREIRDRLGYKTRKSVYDIVAMLNNLGIPVDMSEKEGNAIIYRVDSQILLRWGLRQTAAALGDGDALMLSFLFESFGRSSAIMSMGGNDLVERLSQALEGLDLDRKAPEHGNFFSVPQASYVYLERLLKASKEGLSCTVAYANAEGDEKSYTIWPKKCFTFDGGIYSAVVNTHGQVMFLALQRIKDIVIEEEQQPCPEFDEDIERLVADPFCIVREGPWQHYVIRLDSNQGWYEMQKAWPENVKIKANRDGSYTLTVDTAGRYWLKRWLLSLGPSATVLEPEDLKDEMEKDLEAMLENIRAGRNSN